MSFRNVSGIYGKNSFTLTECNDPDTCLSTEAVRWEDQSSLFLFVEKAIDALKKSSNEILYRNLYFIGKEIQIVLCVFLGKRISRKY